jgi:hypothetical protein
MGLDAGGIWLNERKESFGSVVLAHYCSILFTVTLMLCDCS